MLNTLLSRLDDYQFIVINLDMVQGVIAASVVSVFAGLFVALVHKKFTDKVNSSFVVTLALIPILIQSIIVVVNGSLGMGIAAMGAFSLVRFRSVPGTGREIVTIIFVMAIGLAVGAGQIGFAVLLTLLVCFLLVVFHLTKFSEDKETARNLRVFVPEDLDFTVIFDDLFVEYTHGTSLNKIRTINLGSLYELRYSLELKDLKREKEFLDKIRQRNNNLDIICERPLVSREEM
jgi:hypothetical protein